MTPTGDADWSGSRHSAVESYRTAGRKSPLGLKACSSHPCTNCRSKRGQRREKMAEKRSLVAAHVVALETFDTCHRN